LDLVLEGHDWVVVVENKIYHTQINPFDEYEQYIEQGMADKKAYYVVLSPSGESVKENWLALSYEALISSFETELYAQLVGQSNKWSLYLRDFIINLKQYAVNYKMEKAAFEFVEGNVSQIFMAAKLQGDFLSSLEKKILTELVSVTKNTDLVIKRKPWGERIAFKSRISPSYAVYIVLNAAADVQEPFAVYVYKKPDNVLKLVGFTATDQGYFKANNEFITLSDAMGFLTNLVASTLIEEDAEA
jgi:hypothetical protein